MSSQSKDLKPFKGAKMCMLRYPHIFTDWQSDIFSLGTQVKEGALKEADEG